MRSVEELESRIAELEERLKRHEERTEPMSAEAMYETAKNFIEANPDVWAAICNMARRRAGDGKRVSMKRIIEDLRDTHGYLWQTEDFKLNNSVTACLARFLAKDVPEAKEHMKLHRSKVDRYFKAGQ